MRIRKYLHSCLLFEHEGAKLLFDPGLFSFAEGRVTPDTFFDIDTLVVTHTHADHLHLPSIERIVAASGAKVLGNGEVAEKLRGAGMEAEIFEAGTRQAGPFTLEAIPTPHQPILTGALPQHTAFLVNDRVLNPGDSLGAPLLRFAGVALMCLPVTAPFLTEPEAFDFARRMRPGAVLPVHDGYVRDFFLAQRYEVYEPFLEKLGIRFHPASAPGAAVDLDVR